MFDIVSPSSGEGWRGGFYHSLSHTLTSVEFCSLTRMSSEFEIEVPPLLISKDSAIMCTVLRFTTKSAGFIYLIIIKNFELRFSFSPLFLHLSIEGATEVFRVATECGYGPTKGSESPLATEVKG